MAKVLKSIPIFQTEDEERTFWEREDSADYVDWSRAERVRLPNLQPSTTPISLRLPNILLEKIKIAAHNLTKSHYALWLKATDGARFFGC